MFHFLSIFKIKEHLTDGLNTSVKQIDLFTITLKYLSVERL